MKELEKLYEEREQQREEELRNTLYTMKKVFVSSSSKAFCKGVCKERSNWDNGYVCSCNRHSRYVKSIEEQFDSYMKKNVERIIQEYKDSPSKQIVSPRNPFNWMPEIELKRAGCL